VVDIDERLTKIYEHCTEALWCPFLQLVRPIFEGVDGSGFNDAAWELIPETHNSMAAEILSCF